MKAPSNRVRILLADDHVHLRHGLSCLIARHADLEVVGEACDGESAVKLTRRLRPDVVLMDVTMPGMSGMEATRIITSEMPQIRVVGLSMHEEDAMAVAMRAAGATAYLTKGVASEHLIAAIRGVAVGGCTVCS